MRQAIVKMHKDQAGILTNNEDGTYCFEYSADYTGDPISLSMPVRAEKFEFSAFPPFFDGLLPEGVQLEGLLKSHKIDRNDYFTQLIVTGKDLVGAVTVEELI